MIWGAIWDLDNRTDLRFNDPVNDFIDDNQENTTNNEIMQIGRQAMED